MAHASVASILQALGQYQLLTPAQLEELTRDVEKKFADGKALARELAQRRWLTLFQANLVLQGRARDLVLGSYLLLEKLGEGGMGQVFKARHVQLQREAAIKLIRKERLASTEAVRRYRREVRAAAQLTHPNIVRAYDADQVGELHFLVMEYVEGIDLAKLVQQRGPLPVELAVDYMRQAALGLQHAHDKGLIHRDIKPHNLIVTAPTTPLQGGRRKDDPPGATAIQALPRLANDSIRKGGTIKVLDLGLARTTDEAARTAGVGSLTQEGSVLGTPDYIAPEQVQESRAVDGRADLYSLGCTLYFLLTAQPPFPQGSLAQKLAWHMYAEPTPVEQLRSGLPAGLDTVVRKLMAKRPEDRYQSAAEAAVVLEAYCRSGAPVAILVSAEATATGVTVAVPLPSVTEIQPAHPGLPEFGLQHARAAIVPRPAVVRTRRWRWLLALGLFGIVGLLLLLSLTLGRVASRPASVAQRSTSKIPPEDRFDWQPEGLVQVLGEHRLRHTSTISGMVLSTDGKLVATYGVEHLIRLSDPETLRERRTLTGHALQINALALSRDGRLLASGSYDKTVRLWDTASGKEVQKCEGHTDTIHAVALSPDGRQIVSSSIDRTVRLWDAATGKELRQLISLGPQVLALAISPDGRLAITGSDVLDAKGKSGEALLRLWDLSTGAEVRRFENSKGRINQVAFSPDGTRFLSCEGTIATLWDVQTGKSLQTLPTGATAWTSFSPDGRHAVSCSAGEIYKLLYWELDTGRELRTYKELGNRIAFFPDGRRALFSSRNTLRIWDTQTNNELRPQVGNTAGIRSLAYSKDGKSLLSLGEDSRLRIWDLQGAPATIRTQVQLSNHRNFLGDLSPDGRFALSRGFGNTSDTLNLWDLESGRELRAWPVVAHSLAFAPDSQSLVYGTNDKLVHVFDIVSGAETQLLKGLTGVPVQVEFTPNGKQVFALGSDNTFRLWEAATGAEVRTLKLSALRVALTSDGRWLYTGSVDGLVSRYDLTEREPKPQSFFKYHTNEINSLSLTSDGRTLASSGTDGRVVIWDAATGKKLREWQQPGGVTAVAFAPDCRHLATANGNTTIYIIRLDLPPGRPSPG